MINLREKVLNTHCLWVHGYSENWIVERSNYVLNAAISAIETSTNEIEALIKFFDYAFSRLAMPGTTGFNIVSDFLDCFVNEAISLC